MKHRHSVTENTTEVAGIAAVSAAIGAVIAMVLTPFSGGQLRRDLKRRALHVKDEVGGQLGKTVDGANDVASDAKDRAANSVKKVARDTKSTAAKIASDTKSTSTKVSRDAKATGSAAKSTARTTSTRRRTPSSRS